MSLFVGKISLISVALKVLEDFILNPNIWMDLQFIIMIFVIHKYVSYNYMLCTYLMNAVHSLNDK